MAAPLDIVLRLSGMEALQQGFDKTLKSVQDLGNKLTSAGKTLSLAVTAPIVAFAAIGIAELSSVQAAMAQTEAVIKSTGGVAGVSAKGVRELSESLQGKSAVDAEVIQSGANLLLTFTNIRNVAGKNNDVFDRATKLSLDLSRAFGQDVSSSAIQLGKALNDPIKGVTALTRVGIQFTDAQKDQIKTLVESGKTLEAQKLILAELETQVGGSAEAFRNTMGGSLALMKIQIEDVAGSLVQALEPAITNILAVASKWLTWFNSLDEGTKSMIATLGVLVAAIGPLLLVIGQAIKVFGVLSKTLSFAMNMNPWIIAISALVGAGILLYTNWDKVAAIAKTVWNNIKQTVLIAVELMLEALDHFTGWIPGWGTVIGNAAKSVTAMRISVEKDMAAIQKPMVDTSKEVAKTGEQFKGLATAVPPGINSVTKAVTEMGNAVSKRVIPAFFDLADVQRTMAQTGLPKLKSSFVTLKDSGLTPAEKAFGEMKLQSGLLQQNITGLKKPVDDSTKSFSDMGAQVLTTKSLVQTASESLTAVVKGLWSDTGKSFEDVWKGALSTFADIIIPQMVAVASGAAQSIQWSMAAATAGISLVVGLVGSLFGGKKSKIEVVPLTTRLKQVFDDFVGDFKSSIGGFKDVLFPAGAAGKSLLSQVPSLVSAISKLSQAESVRKTTQFTDEEGSLIGPWSEFFESISKDLKAAGINVPGGKIFSTSWTNRIVSLMTTLSDNLDDLSGLMVDRFEKIKDIVGDIADLYTKQREFSKDIDKSIIDVQRALLSPQEMMTAQLADVEGLKAAIGIAAGEEQIALLGELKSAYLSVWGTAQDIFGEDTAKLIEWQKFAVDGLESIKEAGKTAYDQLIDINLEMLGVQRDGRDIQVQMASYLSTLNNNMISTLKGIMAVAQIGTATPEQLSMVTSTFGQLFEIPKLAHGGIVSKPTLAMIGEAGTEAVVPLTKPGRAAEIMQEAGLSGGGNHISMTQVFRGPVIFDKISMSKWAREQSKLMKREMMRYA